MLYLFRWLYLFHIAVYQSLIIQVCVGIAVMSDAELESLISGLPINDLDLIFAYGSGAVPQKGQNTADNMADFIFCTPNALDFHLKNLSKNRDHYSFVKHFGPGWNARFQNDYAAGVYFNTLVKVSPSNRLIKYGVVEKPRLVEDLLDWKHLYIAGRLHKPVRFIRTPVDEQLKIALKVNLTGAVRTALLFLPESFSRVEFYNKISSLSYAGDFRMTVGEDKKKVSKIVTANVERFDRLYNPILAELDQVQC